MTGRRRDEESTFADSRTGTLEDSRDDASGDQDESAGEDAETSYASGSGGGGGRHISGLNRKLRTEFIDVDPEDESMLANTIRGITGCVGAMLTPRQILVTLRLLKAVTVSMIALTATANIVYVCMVEFVANPYAGNTYFGVRRDTVLRIYGLILSILALMIEMDKFTMKGLKVLKGFLARFVLLFFVACLTYAHPQQWANAGYYLPGSAVVFQMICSIML